jgi:hypothetical protein
VSAKSWCQPAGRSAVVKLLLEEGAELKSRDERRWSNGEAADFYYLDS